MKRIYLTLFLMAVVTGISFGQSSNQAKSILDKVSAKLQTFKGVTANFTYTTKDRNNVKRGSVSGKVSIKGQKYYVKQGSNEIFCNGEKTWNYNGDNEVTVADVDGDSQTLTPQKLLSNFYDKDFTYQLVSSTGNFYEIELVPIDKRKNFKQVNVFVDKAKSMIMKAKVIDKTDNVIEFSLSNVNTAASIPDSKFVFDTNKHPDVEVVTQ